jgi:hypothetical protein
MLMYGFTLARSAVRRIFYDQPPPRRNGELGVFLLFHPYRKAAR